MTPALQSFASGFSDGPNKSSDEHIGLSHGGLSSRQRVAIYEAQLRICSLCPNTLAPQGFNHGLALRARLAARWMDFLAEAPASKKTRRALAHVCMEIAASWKQIYE